MLPRTPSGAALRPRSLRERVREAAAPTALGALLIVSPQLLGGVFPWAMIAIASGAVVCLALALWHARDRGAQDDVTAVGWAMGLCWLFTMLQCVPLPCGLVAWIVPESVERLKDVLYALGEPAATSCTLSFDPGNTRQEVVKGAAIVASFFAAWLLCGCGARTAIVWSVALSTLLMAVVALVHGALGMNEVFGWYEPQWAKRVILLAPIMNQNSLGGFIAMGVPLWIGLGHREPRFEVRMVTYAAMVICVVAVLLTLSRGAIAVLVAATLTMGAAVVLRRRQRDPRKFRWLFNERSLVIVGALTLGAGIGLFGGYGGDARVLKEFELGNTGKLDVIADGFGVAFDHPWVGVGRGAFSSVFLQHGGTVGRFDHPENLVAQWTSEWGIPLGMFLLGTVVVALVIRLRRSLSTQRLGVLVALFAIAAHAMLDIALELLGIAVVAAALMACALAPSRRRRARSTARIQVRVRTWHAGRAVAGLSVGSLLLLSPSLPHDSVGALDSKLDVLIDAGDRAEFRNLLVRGARLHPAEARLMVVATSEALTHNDLRPIARYVNLAMRLAPGWATPHAQAATWLARRGLWMQAFDQVKVAATLDYTSVQELVCMMVKHDPDGVFEAAPTNAERFRYLEVASGCLPASSSESGKFDAAFLREFPTAYWPHYRETMRLSQAGRYEEALARIVAARKLDPHSGPLRVLNAELLLRAGRPSDALRACLEAEPHAPAADRRALLHVRLAAAIELRDKAGIELALAALRGLAGFDPFARAQVLAQEGRAYGKIGELGSSLRAYQEAHRIDPDASHLRAIAQVSEKIGDRRRALAAYLQLCAENPQDSAACAKRDALVGGRP